MAEEYEQTYIQTSEATGRFSRSQRIRPSPIMMNRLQEAILSLINPHLTEQERSLPPAERQTAYSERIEKALEKAPTHIGGEELPPKEQT